MGHHESAKKVAESLLAVTLSAIDAVEYGDWETAGQLLRRREQLLTQLESCDDVPDAERELRAVQAAELDLQALLERTATEALDGMASQRAFRAARKAYRPSVDSSFFDQAG
ncbi:MAG: hypothetical protein KatS3mg015_0932 [Fimbriimonadales bacterium]|nr:MAG: hypothetical protein KatS3mg015_0932 [Fimbriimonadales bacterium]